VQKNGDFMVVGACQPPNKCIHLERRFFQTSQCWVCYVHVSALHTQPCQVKGATHANVDKDMPYTHSAVNQATGPDEAHIHRHRMAGARAAGSGENKSLAVVEHGSGVARVQQV
jgi:hypothetical protein